MANEPRPLAPREAYRLWAPSYQTETAVSALDELAVADLAPVPMGALLDAGCGTGRRLASAPAGKLRVGVDLVREMLLAGFSHQRQAPRVAAADVRALPLAAHVFDTIWCRLVLGHVSHLEPAYRELARVARPGACLVVTDFHPAALSAGHARTFRDQVGMLHAVEAHPHEIGEHAHAAATAGYRLETAREWRVGPDVKPFYRAAGMLKEYQEQLGMALLFALRFAR